MGRTAIPYNVIRFRPSPNFSPEACSMYKALCVASLVLAAFAFTSGSKSLAELPSGPTYRPVIVARGALQNQTEPLSATIYTPLRDGLFRLSVYATITTADPN